MKKNLHKSPRLLKKCGFVGLTLLIAAANVRASTPINIAAGEVYNLIQDTSFVGSQVTIAAGGTLNLNGFNLSVFSIQADGDINLESGTLTFDTIPNQYIYSKNITGSISGTGGITIANGYTLSLNGINTYTGSTTISGNGGTLLLESQESLPSGTELIINSTSYEINLYGPSNISVLSGGGNDGRIFILDQTGSGIGQLTLNNINENTYAGSLEGDQFIKEGTGKLILIGALQTDEGTIVNGGTLQLGNGTNDPYILSNIINNSIVSFNLIDQKSYNYVMSGTGEFRHDGTNTTTLTAIQTYTGDTVINNGTIQIGVANATAANSTHIVNAPGVLDLNGLDTEVGGLAGTGTVNLTANTLTLGQNNETTTFSGVINGTGGLIKVGTGTQTLSGTNTYTGNTLISEGTLQIGAGGTSGSISGNITNNSNITFNRSDDYTYSGSIYGTGSLTKEGSGTLTLTKYSDYTGNTTVNNGTLKINISSSGNSILSSDIINNSKVIIDSTGIGQYPFYDQVISGTGDLEITPGQSFYILSKQTYTGKTTIKQGNIHASINNIFENSSSIQIESDGGLYMENHDQSIRTLNGSGEVVLSDSTLTIGNGNGDSAFSGRISDLSYQNTNLGNLIKIGSGTVALSGINTYAGFSQVNEGTLLIVGAQALAGDATVASDATLAFQTTGNNDSLTQILTGAGNFSKRGTGTLTAGSTLQVTGTIGAEAGVLILDGWTGNGTLHSAAGAEIHITNHNNTNFGNDLTGAGDYRFSNGEIILTGISTGTGRLIVDDNHILNLGGTATSPAVYNRSVEVLSGGELRGSASLVNLTNAGTLSIGASPGTIVLSGDFVNSGVLNIEIEGTGAGQYDLVRYAGSAVISAGSTLNVTFGGTYTPTAGDSVLFLEDTNLNIGGFTGSFTTENLPTLTDPWLSSAVIRTANGMAYTVFNRQFNTGLVARKGNENFVANVSGNTAGYTPIASAGVLNGNEWMRGQLTKASPFGLASMEALILDEGRTHAKFILGRARDEAARREYDANAWTTFAQVHGAYTDWRLNGEKGGNFNQNFHGGKAGLSNRVTDQISAGLVGGYDDGAAHIHDGGGKVTQNRGSISAYVTAAPTENTLAFAAITGGVSYFKTTRHNILGTETGSANAYDIALTVGGEAKFDLTHHIDTTSYAHLNYHWINTDGFSENGTAFAGHLQSRYTNSLRLRVGQDIGWTANTGGGFIRFSIGGAFEHEMLRDDVTIRGAFANGTGRFDVYAETLSRNSIGVTPAITWSFDGNQSITASYTYEYGLSKTDSNRFDVAYRVSF